MNALLPLSARRIGLAWPIKQGGIGVTARTDFAGQPYIGLYPLNFKGQPAGHPLEYPRPRLMINVVAGYDKDKSIIVFIDIAVTAQGLDVRIVPQQIGLLGFRRAARWGSPCPLFPDHLANPNWTVVSYLREEDF